MPTAELEVVRGRLDTLESRMSGQERMSATRDHDVADIKQRVNANHTLLQALGETQSDHGKRLRNIESDVSEIKSDVSGLKSDVSGLKSDVSGLKGDMAMVMAKVQNTEAGVKTILGMLEARQ